MFGQLLIGALVIGAIYGMLSLGYSLIYQASGYMNFTQGDLLTLGCFIGWQGFVNWKLPFPIAFIISIVCMFLFGMLMERCIIRVLINKKAINIYVVLATIGLSTIIQNSVMLIWGSRTFQFPSIFPGVKDINLFGMAIVPERIMALCIAVIAMFALHFFMSKTRFGTSMRASAQNKIAASVMGINVWTTISVTYGIAAALAGIGGMTIGPILGANMNLGAQLGIKGFAGAVIGGYGHMYGAIVGALLLGIVETFAAGYIPSMYKDFITYAVLILVICVMPRGIFNAKVYD